MQVSSSEAIKKGMVKTREGSLMNAEKYSMNSSIDISIGEVLIRDEKSGEVKSMERHQLLPQETVYLISDELIDIPNDHIAYVFLKNRFSQKGVIAFNTGIIDAGYRGHISTLITNLSLESVDLKMTRDCFFRIVFQKLDEPIKKSTTNMTLDEYRQERMVDLGRLPKLFLNPDGIKKQINEELNEKALNFGFIRIGLLFGLLGAVLMVVPPLTEIISESIKIRFSNESEAKVLDMGGKIKLNSVETERLKSSMHKMQSELTSLKKNLAKISQDYAGSKK